MNGEDVNVTVLQHSNNATVAFNSFDFDLFTNYTFAAVGSQFEHNTTGGASIPAGVSVHQIVDDNTYVAHSPKIRFLHLVRDYNGVINVTIGGVVADAFAGTLPVSESNYTLSTHGKKLVELHLPASGNATTGPVLSSKVMLSFWCNHPSFFTFALFFCCFFLLRTFLCFLSFFF